MKEITQKKVLENLIKSIAELYKLSIIDVEDAVCQVISDVLSAKLGYQVDVSINANQLRLIGRQYRYGYEKDIIIPPTHIKYTDFITIENRLKHLLDFRQSQKEILKYNQYIGSIVFGRIISKHKDDYYVSLNLNNEKVIGVCKLSDLPRKERETAGKEYYFYVSSLKKEIIDNRIRITIYLSRRSKKFPNVLYRYLTSDNTVTLKCIKRNAGKISIYTSNKPIKKSNIKKLSQALNGEIIVFRKVITNE